MREDLGIPMVKKLTKLLLSMRDDGGESRRQSGRKERKLVR